MIVCQENLHHAQKLQKQAHNKATKPMNYVPGNKVWLNSKYIKTKHNWKLGVKFFGLFRVIHPVEKQAYKLELPKKWKIHGVFHVSLLEQNTIRKRRVGKNAIELDVSDENKEYMVEAIWDSTVYARELKSGYLSGFYYLVL